uniref:Uncharacterized protein n=1 Tax=Oryza barthii TaxID=65489 RepID=A0A0D3FED4_9ORYZ
MEFLAGGGATGESRERPARVYPYHADSDKQPCRPGIAIPCRRQPCEYPKLIGIVIVVPASVPGAEEGGSSDRVHHDVAFHHLLSRSNGYPETTHPIPATPPLEPQEKLIKRGEFVRDGRLLRVPPVAVGLAVPHRLPLPRRRRRGGLLIFSGDQLVLDTYPFRLLLETAVRKEESKAALFVDVDAILFEHILWLAGHHDRSSSSLLHLDLKEIIDFYSQDA